MFTIYGYRLVMALTARRQERGCVVPNSSLKVAPFGRWTPQKRGAL